MNIYVYICTHMYMQTCVNTCVYNKDKYRYSQTRDEASVLEGRKMFRKLFFFFFIGKEKGVKG